MGAAPTAVALQGSWQLAAGAAPGQLAPGRLRPTWDLKPLEAASALMLLAISWAVPVWEPYSTFSCTSGLAPSLGAGAARCCLQRGAGGGRVGAARRWVLLAAVAGRGGAVRCGRQRVWVGVQACVCVCGGRAAHLIRASSAALPVSCTGASAAGAGAAAGAAGAAGASDAVLTGAAGWSAAAAAAFWALQHAGGGALAKGAVGLEAERAAGGGGGAAPGQGQGSRRPHLSRARMAAPPVRLDAMTPAAGGGRWPAACTAGAAGSAALIARRACSLAMLR
jgi:hypothetical protein